MPNFSQNNRYMAITTSLGTDAMLLETFSGSEALNELFEFDLGVLVEPDTTINFETLLGQTATIEFRTAELKRHFHGIVSRVAEGAQLRGPKGDVTFTRYRLTLVPKLWLLTRRTNIRIFQQMTIPDILKTVLTGIDVNWGGLQGTFEKRDYCVQYRETDFDFMSRLMEEEGIYYYFDHTNGAHSMIVGNAPGGHRAVVGDPTLQYETITGGNRPSDENRIHSWTKMQEIRSGKSTLWDHCFEKPQPPGFDTLAQSKSIQGSVAVGTVSHSLTAGGAASLELYDYPGGYAQRFDGIDPGGGARPADIGKIPADGVRTVDIREQQEAARGIAIAGGSTARHLSAGHKFTLENHFNADGDYVLTRVEHSASLTGTYTHDGGFDEPYRNDFRCIPYALPFRPAQVTPKAFVRGTHTATVVGDPGQEIFTDKYGRVKVQFHWDREHHKNAESSCWIRVGTHWAGKQWGAIHIPRIGQEVIVAFEEGDPDKPIIVGSVYNAEMMPPFTLPENKTISGIKTRSSLKGTPNNYNELTFEDKIGEENICIHAEKDFERYVENNDFLTVGFRQNGAAPDKGNREVQVFNNEFILIGHPHEDGTNPYEGNQELRIWNDQWVTVGNGKGDAATGDQFTEIWNNQINEIGFGQGSAADGSQYNLIWKDRKTRLQTGDDTLLIDQGDRTVTVKEGERTTSIKKDDKLTIKSGDRVTTLNQGNDELTIKLGNHETKVSLGSYSIEAMQKITFTVGSNSIEITQSGITIKGMQVKIEGQSMVEMKSPMTTVKGDGMLTLKGGITMIN